MSFTSHLVHEFAGSAMPSPPPSQPAELPPEALAETHGNRTAMLYVFQKNCRGLISNDRLDELIIEVEDIKWDILLLNETWRDEPHEYLILREGHLFAASGGVPGARGVAFLINKRWIPWIQCFVPIDERLAYINLQIHNVAYRFVTTYFPHGGYGDAAVQQMYAMIDECHADAKRKRQHFILGGDFNADVGHGLMEMTQAHLGNSALGQRAPEVSG